MQFTPPFYLQNPHLQTIWAARVRYVSPFPYKEEKFTLPDNDFLMLYWRDVELEKQHNTPLVFFIHGVSGSAQSIYVRGMIQQLYGDSLGCVGISLRSAGNIKNNTAKAYHAGETEDLRAIVLSLQKRFPNRPLIGVGFSLGGNILLNYLSRYNDLFAGCAISVPIDMIDAAKAIRTKKGRIYERNFVKRLKKLVLIKEVELQKAGLDTKKLLRVRNIRDFDHHGTAPLYGFESAEDYYMKTSSKPHFHKIQVPTLLLQAKDDPVLGSKCYPLSHEIPSSMTYIEENFGGHVGFLPSIMPKTTYSETQVRQFLQNKIQNISH
jgi:uncharacterized protein